MTTITIDRIDDTVFCRPQGGNLRVNRTGQVKWQCRKGLVFRLTFRFEPFQGMPPRTSDWPFSPTIPTAPSTDWVEEFTATAIDGDGVFEYLVEVKEADGSIVSLDPIIIIRD